MIRPPRVDTPQPVVSAESLRLVKTDRALMAPQAERTTPEDIGVTPQQTGNVTLRKLRVSDGAEVWNASRGAPAYATATSFGCRTVMEREAVSGGRLDTIGSATTGVAEGDVVRWLDLGASAAVRARSRTAADDPYSADGPNGTLANSRWGKRLAQVSLDLLWTAGDLNPITGTRQSAVQAYDRDTLRGEFVTPLPIRDPDGGGSEQYSVAGIASSPDGIVVDRRNANAIARTNNSAHAGAMERVDADGTHTTSLEWYAWRRNSALAVSFPDTTGTSSLLATIGATTYVWQRALAIADTGRAFFLVLTDNPGASPSHAMSLVGTDTDLAVAFTVPVSNAILWKISGSLWTTADTAFTSTGLLDEAIVTTDDVVAVVTRNTWPSGTLTQAASGLTGVSLPIATVSTWVYDLNLFDHDGNHLAHFTLPHPTGAGTGGTANSHRVVTADNEGSLFVRWPTSAGTATGYAKITTAGEVLWHQAGTAIGVYADGISPPFTVYTANGVTYFVGLNTSYSGVPQDVVAVSGTTGAVLWRGRHRPDGSSGSLLLDAVAIGDYLYVAGIGSTYRP